MQEVRADPAHWDFYWKQFDMEKLNMDVEGERE